MDRGDLVEARRLMKTLQPIMIAGFVESNPMPMKAAMAELGRMEDAVRLPLVRLADERALRRLQLFCDRRLDLELDLITSEEYYADLAAYFGPIEIGRAHV